ncbi:type II secretion system protein N [Acinetobacter radioresistens]|uniref:type II secretion system protein N n=1 Tax=Acinetobacter radioresistens TaxID=40216 RepID=UPI00202ECB0F|nr:type II secretion system protein N [Acinetobacter radioresistens]MCM1935670.1 PDZ domain-containing protein [Acinetobacter radioresistens]MCM1953647.1 PDZ domain-containing protein [Acinetobacter radioresistens]MCU4308335.1 PDZ domain-containing protein [Acinetobacter radioresistens]MCU4566254.1 PDZ domain-containing protein [Acinetobacter radioresistens]
MKTYLNKLQDISWSKLDRAGPFVLSLLILIFCWKLAALFWWVVAPPQGIQFERVMLGSQQPQVPNISSFSLFYEPGQSAAANTSAESLNIELQGVVIGYPSRYSSAVIKVDQIAERYRVGETIANSSFQLAEVYWDRVILRQPNGTSREVQFKGIENGLNQPIVPPADPATSAAPSPSPANSSQSALGQAIQKIQEDREQYLQEMGVSSTGNGYEVTSRTPAALRSKLGLRPGDRIMSLNGQPVGQGQSDIQLLEQARREGQVKIEIKRGDQVMTIQQSF